MITARFFGIFTGVLATAVSCQPQPQTPKFERVVLVHGIFEDGHAFTSLKKRLEHHGIHCLVPKLKPNSGRGGLEKIAAGLKSDIDKEFGETDKIAIVGFSMGGIVSRYYLQKLGGAKRCEELITISSPHHGTDTAWLFPTKGAEQMRPGSPFLKDLAETEDTLGEIPIVSYRTPMDLVILPTNSSIWARAENRSHPVVLHPLMLQTKSVLDDIERRFIVLEK